MVTVRGNNEYSRTIINKETHEVVCIESDKVLLRSILDEELIYVELNDVVIEEFNLPIETENVHQESEDNTTNIKKVWSKEATLRLITMYKERQEKFKSTKIKNDRVWNEIAEEMKRENLTPVAIASSMSCEKFEEGETSQDSGSLLSESDDQATPKKPKRETENEARERRHKERLQKQTEAITTCKTLMEKLIEKL